MCKTKIWGEAENWMQKSQTQTWGGQETRLHFVLLFTASPRHAVSFSSFVAAYTWVDISTTSNGQAARTPMLQRTYVLTTPTNMCHIKTGGKLSSQQLSTLNFTAKQPTCSDNVSIIKCKTLVKCIHMMQRVSEGRPYLQTASTGWTTSLKEHNTPLWWIENKWWWGVSQIDPQSQGIQMQVLAPGAHEQQSLSTWETR